MEIKEAEQWLRDYHLIVDLLYGICILFGIVTNPLTICICIRSNLRKTPTFIFILFGAITNLISLFSSPVNYFLGGFVFDINLRNRSLIWCKLQYFLTFYMLHCNVWFLVLSIVEIYLTVRFVNFRPKYSNSRYAIFSCLIMTVILFLLNVPKLALHGFVLNQNGTEKVVCLKSVLSKPFEIAGLTLNAVIYSALPSIIIFTTNILLIGELKKSRSRFLNDKSTENQKERSNHRLAVTQLIFASLFLAVTLPRSVASVYFIINKTHVSFLFAKICDLIIWTYFNLTIFILLAHNKPFRREFKALILNSGESRSSFST